MRYHPLYFYELFFSKKKKKIKSLYRLNFIHDIAFCAVVIHLIFLFKINKVEEIVPQVVVFVTVFFERYTLLLEKCAIDIADETFITHIEFLIFYFNYFENINRIYFYLSHRALFSAHRTYRWLDRILHSAKSLW
jgi:hypothetical protein